MNGNIVDDEHLSALELNTLNELYGPVKHINGRRILGPLKDWRAEPPSSECEIFIKNIPRTFTEVALWHICNRFGWIYEVRLMMDFSVHNRGYCYVKYLRKEDACRALDLLSRYFLSRGKRLSVSRSYSKCRLFVNNIPKHLSEEDIRAGFQELFPNVCGVILRNRISDVCEGQGNRGFAFLDFPSHEEALAVKKKTTPGRIRMWERDIRIVWASPESYRGSDFQTQVTNLFVRNIAPSVSHGFLKRLVDTTINSNETFSIQRQQETAYINFSSRSTAEEVLNKLNGRMIHGYSLSVDWALPSRSNMDIIAGSKDYDAQLRMLCIANSWATPVIIFGYICHSHMLQTAAVIIRENGRAHSMYFEVLTTRLVDIQSRICEAAYYIIEKLGGLSELDLVVKVHQTQAWIVGTLESVSNSRVSIRPMSKFKSKLHTEFIRKIAVFVKNLQFFSHEQILAMYYSTASNASTCLRESLINAECFLTALDPNYRARPPLKHNLDNTQLIFAMACRKLRRNFYLNVDCKIIRIDSVPQRYSDNNIFFADSMNFRRQFISSSSGANCVVYVSDTATEDQVEAINHFGSIVGSVLFADHTDPLDGKRKQRSTALRSPGSLRK